MEAAAEAPTGDGCLRSLTMKHRISGIKNRTRHHLLPHMLAGERGEDRGRIFRPQKEQSASPLLQFLVLVLLASFPPLPNENKQKPRNTTKEKESKAERSKAMGDASSNHAVLAAGDAGQPNFGGGGNSNSSAAAAGGFVALDVGALSSLAGEVGAPEAVASPRRPRTPKVVRSLSRKGERKPADVDGNGGNAGGGERPQLFVHVAAGDLGDANGARLVVHTPVAGTPGGKSRRLGRRPAPWLDPRRVVFLFATLSSVGTLILLYFTLSMSRTGDSGAAAASDAR